MATANALLLARKELAQAWRNRWFLAYAGCFTLLALTMSWLSLAGAAGSGFATLGRTAAGLLNLVILVVPLMGLTLAGAALAGERQSGSLLYLMAQPVSVGEVLLGKFLGLTGAVVSALLAGFGAAALVIAARGAGGAPGPFLAFLALAVLMAAGSVSLGLLISALAPHTGAATGAALLVWLILVLFGDLGLMAGSLTLRLGLDGLVTAALANPLQVFKVASVLVLRGGLEVLGPAGQYLTRRWGDHALPLLTCILAVWALLPLAAAFYGLRRKGALP